MLGVFPFPCNCFSQCQLSYPIPMHPSFPLPFHVFHYKYIRLSLCFLSFPSSLSFPTPVMDIYFLNSSGFTSHHLDFFLWLVLHQSLFPLRWPLFVCDVNVWVELVLAACWKVGYCNCSLYTSPVAIIEAGTFHFISRVDYSMLPPEQWHPFFNLFSSLCHLSFTPPVICLFLPRTTVFFFFSFAVFRLSFSRMAIICLFDFLYVFLPCVICLFLSLSHVFQPSFQLSQRPCVYTYTVFRRPTLL